jgi:hypothetical protein
VRKRLVRGIIVGGKPDTKLQYAVDGIPNPKAELNRSFVVVQIDAPVSLCSGFADRIIVSSLLHGGGVWQLGQRNIMGRGI